MPEIDIRRGLEVDMPTLDIAEPGFATDTENFFIGGNNRNIQFAKQQDVDSLTEQVTTNSDTLNAIIHIDANAELVNSRGIYSTLGDRLNSADESLSVTSETANKNAGILSTMRDPLAYLNSVEILCSFSARGTTATAWTQGFSINEATNEIYVAIQENNGTYLTIEIRNLDGSFKDSKTLTIDSGAFTEGLPFFYNGINQLCFIVRTQVASTYVIYNYDLGLLSSPVAINGTPYKSAVEGNYFITCDATSSAPYSINTVYVYDFASVQSGTPTLLNSFKLSKMTTASIEKVQGIVLNNGYLFLIQGESNGNPVVTVYNTAGQLVTSYPFTKESLAAVINSFSPGAIADISNYTYENEGGCKYKGKLVVAHIINSVLYVTIHNSPSGTALETKVPIYRMDTDWQSVSLLNGAIQFASDTTPRIRRIGNQVMLDGAISGIATLNQEFIDFGTQYAPDRNFQAPQVTTGGFQCNWQIQPNGRAKILNSKNTPLATTDWYPFHITWFI